MSLDIKIKTTLSAAALSAFSALPVYAEEAKTLDTVVVTGELQQRNLQDTQTSTQVISGEDLDTSTDNSFYNLVERTPGVTARFGEKGFTLRGVDQAGFSRSDGGTGMTVNVSVDGADLPSSLATFFGPYSTWDTEQVEVLLGPQSTQQGRNALAGAVHIKTADPQFEERETRIRADIGSRDTARFAVAHNEPINDTIAARIAIDHTQTDGWVKNPTRNEDDYDAREFNSGRVKLRVRPNDQLNAVFSHAVTDSIGGEDFIEANRYPSERVNLSDARGREGSKHYITGANVTYDLQNNWSLESQTNIYQHDYDRSEDIDQNTQSGYVFDYLAEDTSYSQEVKMTFNNQKNMRGTFGLYGTRIDNNIKTKATTPGEVFSSALAPLGLTVTVDDVTKIDTENTALFGEIEYDLHDRLTLIVGARYDYEKNSRSSTFNRSSNIPSANIVDSIITGQAQALIASAQGQALIEQQVTQNVASQAALMGLANPTPAQQAAIEAVVRPLVVAGAPALAKQMVTTAAGAQIQQQVDMILSPANTSSENSYDAFLPKLGLVYHLSDMVSTGFVVQRGYRAGGSRVNTITAQENRYDPEFTTNYEASLRTESADGRMRFNSNVFYTEWEDMQVDIKGNSGSQFDLNTVNAGEAKLQGIEFSGDIQLNENLNVFAVASFADTEFTKFVSNGVDYKGKQFRLAPKTTASIGGTYYITDNWVSNIDLAYTGESYADQANSALEKIPSRTLTNAKFGYEADTWSAYIYGRNLFDKEYINSSNQVDPNNTASTSSRLVRTGEPRFVGVQLNANF